MAKRFTDTELWDKEWFMNLSPRLKCLVKYVRDKCDAAGIWQPNWVLAKTYIRDKVCEKDLFEIDGGNQFKKLGNGQIFCVGFIAFQYGELSEKCAPHRKIIAILNKYSLINERVLLGYQNPTERVQEEEEEKEEEKEVETEEKGIDFEKFWSAYPRKEEKKKSKEKWDKLAKETQQKILDTLPRFLKDKEVKFVPMPTTYFNNARWEDEIEVEKHVSAYAHIPSI